MSQVNGSVSKTPVKVSGTKEWAAHSCNIVLGCSHRCRYCYARGNAIRRGQCQSQQSWGTTYNRLRPNEVKRGRKKLDGRVMFPTTHDITPEFLEPCRIVLRKLLEAGNDVLIVSKPHLQCIQKLCEDFIEFRDAIMFRFSIGSCDDSILSYWEPGAPDYSERLASLSYAFDMGFATSVSAEPLLDAAGATSLVDSVSQFVSDSIWIGMLNGLSHRVVSGTSQKEINRIQEGQSIKSVRKVYESLSSNPKVKWKESYKSVLGLELSATPGLDI